VGKTASGYNAALLAARLGAPHVTTIEVDPQLASHARAALTNTGFDRVTVITGDGLWDKDRDCPPLVDGCGRHRRTSGTDY
jgi:protein-L-isoaspartate O-methyltransferase